MQTSTCTRPGEDKSGWRPRIITSTQDQTFNKREDTPTGMSGVVCLRLNLHRSGVATWSSGVWFCCTSTVRLELSPTWCRSGRGRFVKETYTDYHARTVCRSARRSREPTRTRSWPSSWPRSPVRSTAMFFCWDPAAAICVAKILRVQLA